MQACDSDSACAMAHIGLTMCIGEQVCAVEAAAFKAMRSNASDAEAASARYNEMEECVSRWARDESQAR